MTKKIKVSVGKIIFDFILSREQEIPNQNQLLIS
jgi:hypothetical protein